MSLRTAAWVIAIGIVGAGALAPVGAEAQPPPATGRDGQPPVKQGRPRRPVPPQIATVDANVEQIGFRDAAGWRTVYVKVRVVRARGANPVATEVVPAPAGELGTLPRESTTRDRPAFRPGSTVWVAYRCRLERGVENGCGVGTNHPAGLQAVGRVTLVLAVADVHASEVPDRPVGPPATGPRPPPPGPVFREVVEGVVQRTVVQVVVTEPGGLRTDTGPMVVGG